MIWYSINARILTVAILEKMFDSNGRKLERNLIADNAYKIVHFFFKNSCGFSMFYWGWGGRRRKRVMVRFRGNMQQPRVAGR